MPPRQFTPCNAGAIHRGQWVLPGVTVAYRLGAALIDNVARSYQLLDLRIAFRFAEFRLIRFGFLDTALLFVAAKNRLLSRIEHLPDAHQRRSCSALRERSETISQQFINAKVLQRRARKCPLGSVADFQDGPRLSALPLKAEIGRIIRHLR
jgi:hypothetical protein